MITLLYVFSLLNQSEAHLFLSRDHNVLHRPGRVVLFHCRRYGSIHLRRWVSFFFFSCLSFLMSIRVHGFLSLKPNFKSLKHWKWFVWHMKNVASFKFHLLIFWFHLQVAFSFNFSSKPYYSWTQNPNLFSFVKISEVCGRTGGTITRSDIDEEDTYETREIEAWKKVNMTIESRAVENM
jgi:hypothetical protein